MKNKITVLIYLIFTGIIFATNFSMLMSYLFGIVTPLSSIAISLMQLHETWKIVPSTVAFVLVLSELRFREITHASRWSIFLNSVGVCLIGPAEVVGAFFSDGSVENGKDILILIIIWISTLIYCVLAIYPMLARLKPLRTN